MPFDSLRGQPIEEPVLLASGETTARLQEDARAKPASVATISVQPGETMRSIGRRLYLERQGHLPSDLELKAFEDDTAARTGLKTKSERDQLRPGQVLTVKLPAMEVGKSRRAIVQKPQPRAKENAPSCSGSWEDVNLIARSITQNEAGRKAYTAYNPDDHGNGVSVGLMQWNQKRGKLPDLLSAWHNKNAVKFASFFGRHAGDLLTTSYVKGADFNYNRTLRRGMEQALADGEFQQVQLALRNAHVEISCEVARDYRFTSLRGRAIVADLVNQLGEGGTRRILSRVPQLPSESSRIERLKDITDGRINGVDRVAAIEDRVRVIWRQAK